MSAKAPGVVEHEFLTTAKKRREAAQGIFRTVADMIDTMSVEFAPKLEDVGEIQKMVGEKLKERYCDDKV